MEGQNSRTCLKLSAGVGASISSCCLLVPPKLNGHVERAQRTHTEEFYELTGSSFDMVEINQALRKWELVYDTVRPHQSLGYLTPHQFLENYHHNRKEVMCH